MTLANLIFKNIVMISQTNFVVFASDDTLKNFLFCFNLTFDNVTWIKSTTNMAQNCLFYIFEYNLTAYFSKITLKNCRLGIIG